MERDIEHGAAERIDFHAHILPGADHGSDSLACSRAQMEKARKAGVGTIVATPHFYLNEQTLEHFLERRDLAYGQLTAAEGCPRILKAAEVALMPGLEKLSGLPALCVEHTDYILLEMPRGIWNEWVYDTIYEIEAGRRLRPIIAHIDRYPKSSLQRLFDLNVMTQVNAESLLPLGNRRFLRELFRRGRAHVLGSDAHGAAEEYRAFSKAGKILGDLYGTVMDNARRMLNNEAIF